MKQSQVHLAISMSNWHHSSGIAFLPQCRGSLGAFGPFPGQMHQSLQSCLRQRSGFAAILTLKRLGVRGRLHYAQRPGSIRLRVCVGPWQYGGAVSSAAIIRARRVAALLSLCLVLPPLLLLRLPDEPQAKAASSLSCVVGGFCQVWAQRFDGRSYDW